MTGACPGLPADRIELVSRELFCGHGGHGCPDVERATRQFLYNYARGHMPHKGGSDISGIQERLIHGLCMVVSSKQSNKSILLQLGKGPWRNTDTPEGLWLGAKMTMDHKDQHTVTFQVLEH